MRANNRYDIFVRQSQDLAETLVIKSEETALRINKNLKLINGPDAVDDLDLSSWKYYLNICGEYHETDTQMQVVSDDTGELITFSKDNLAVHKSTAKSFYYNSRPYIDLLEKYPLQERLILGIMYPANMDAAIDADDFSILSYPPYLVESNEYSLIDNIGKWIKRFCSRWDNPQYNISDELYIVGLLGVMYLNLVPVILNLRQEACKTNEAHSFHVFHYLASFGFDDYYFEFLTKEQALFFYRNINHITRNSGTQENFSWLIEKVMTLRGLPIAGFTMNHDLSRMSDSGVIDLAPTVKFQREALNLPNQQLGPESLSLQSILRKEDILARDNAKFRELNFEAIDDKLKYSKVNKLNTKYVESYVVDYSKSAVYPFAWILLNHWIYCSANDLLTNTIAVNNPRTGEKIVLSNKDALLLYYYAIFAAAGRKIKYAPEVVAQRITRMPVPTVSELAQYSDSEFFSLDYVHELQVAQPRMSTMNNADAFYQFSKSLFLTQEHQVNLIASQDHRLGRAYVKNIVAAFYSDVWVDLKNIYSGKLSTWLVKRNLKLDEMTSTEFTDLALNIFNNATGVDKNPEVSVRDVQNAMVDIMRKFSSYSVQFGTEIIDSNIVFCNFDSIRYDGLVHQHEGNLQMQVGGAVIHGIHPEKIDSVHLGIQIKYEDGPIINEGSSALNVETGVTVDSTGFYSELILDIGGVVFGADTTTSSDPRVFGVPGAEETYNTLTPAQKALVYNPYSGERFVENNYNAVFIPIKTFLMFKVPSIQVRELTRFTTDLSRSLPPTEPQLAVTLGENAEIASVDAVKIFGPFDAQTGLSLNDRATLNQPALNSLRVTAGQIGSLYRIIPSPVF